MVKYIVYIALAISCLTAFSDTPPVTKVTANQGSAGTQDWLFNLTKIQGLAPSVTNYLPARITNGTTYVDPTQIRTLSSGTDSVTVSGSITAMNSANGATGSPVPAQATQVGGSDGVNLRALKVSSSGVLSVDGSASTQPVSGSVSVTNFPGVQPVSQSGSWTVQQGSPPWSMNLSQLAGLSFSATNYLPSRITNGTSYVDPTQIRALSSGTDSVSVGNFPATQPVSGTVTANAGTGTFTVGQSSGANLHADIDNFPATQAVTQSTSPWVVSGTVTANQGGSWTVTANAGTNLNTSLLALDTSVNGILVSQGSTTAGEKGPLIQGAVTTLAPSYTTAQTSPLSLTTSGALRVDGSGATQPVSGTVTANQGGTWNINNISGTISLPTGAATSANQTTANTSLASIDSKTPTLGQAAMASSSPVVIASDQNMSTGYFRQATGSFTATSQTATINPSGAQTVVVQLSGTFVATFTMEESNDNGTTWTPVFGWDQGNTSFSATGNVSGRMYTFPAYGNLMRARCSAFSSGTMIVTMMASIAPMPSVYVTSSTFFPVQGSVGQGNLIGSINPVLMGAVFQTSPATLTNNEQAMLQTDSSQNLKVTVNTALPAGSNSIGAVTQGTSPWVDNITQFGGSSVVTGTGASGAGIPRVTVSNDSNILATQSGTWNITNVSGTVSLPTGASTSANQTNGSQKTQVVDGSGNVQGPVVTISGTNYMPVTIAASAISGSALVARSVQVAGSDGTNAQNLSTDTTGKLNVNAVNSGTATSTNTRNNYSTTNVTTGAFVTLITSTSVASNSLYIFDSSGQTLRLNYAATCGALAAGTNELYVVPGGNGFLQWQVPSGQCVGIEAISANATSGELDINWFK